MRHYKTVIIRRCLYEIELLVLNRKEVVVEFEKVNIKILWKILRLEKNGEESKKINNSYIWTVRVFRYYQKTKACTYWPLEPNESREI